MGLYQAHSSSGTCAGTASFSPENLVEGVGDEVLLLVAAQAEQLGPQLPAKLLRRDPRLLLLQFFKVEHLGKEEPAAEGAQRWEMSRASSPTSQAAASWDMLPSLSPNQAPGVWAALGKHRNTLLHPSCTSGEARGPPK